MDASCSAEQLEELEALRAIFGEDCEVQSEAPGSVAFVLRLDVDLALGDAEVQLLAELPEEGEAEEGPQVAQSSDGRRSAVALAEKLIAGRTASPSSAVVPLERSTSGRQVVRRQASVRHLPPITLQVSLPANYPAEALPDFQLSCLWLASSQLAQLCAEMDSRAAEMPGAPVIYAWAEMLRQETAVLLGLGTVVTLAPLEHVADMRAIAECADPNAAILELLVHDKTRELKLWRQEKHTCAICFCEKAGTLFVHLGGCAHAFCRECTCEMARLHVTEGSIAELRCPDPRCRAEISPGALGEVLDGELYGRWHRLKLQQVLNSELEGVVFCPRCQEAGVETPVMSEPGTTEDEPPVGNCEKCGYVFCANCLDLYHASSSPCTLPEDRAAQAAWRRSQGRPLTLAERRKLKRVEKGYVIEIQVDDSPLQVDAVGCLVEERDRAKVGEQVIAVYAGTKDAKAPKVLWARSEHDIEALPKALAAARPLSVRLTAPEGHSQQEQLKQLRLAEELLTLRAIARDSMPCPSCHLRIQRSMGCNHMTCTQCKTHFCYRCGAKLDPHSPYSHFSSTSCPTFDQEEVQRMAVEERRGDDLELQRLRAEFGHQQELFAQFQAGRALRAVGIGVGAVRQRLAEGGSQCPTCRQWNVRNAQHNHIRCAGCRTSYCHRCRHRIEGVVALHFRGAGACPQHGDS